MRVSPRMGKGSFLLGSAVALFVSVAVGCTGQPAYICTSNTQCISSSGAQGICETSGACAFPDSACSGTGQAGLRYGDGASSNANACVSSAKSCVTAISVGIYFNCALRSDGTVWCWGINTWGNLGNDSTADSAVPVQVKGLPSAATNPAVSVSAAEMHACALLKDQTVWCWGINDQLQLGQCNQAYPNPTLAQSQTAVEVQAFAAPSPPASGADPTVPPPSPACLNTPFKATQLTSGGEHNCAIGADTNLYCWGENTTNNQGGQSGQPFSAAQAGTGKYWTEAVPGPEIVVGTTPNQFSEVLSGDDISCGIAQGSAYCWGGNEVGELSPAGGSFTTPSPDAANCSDTPVLISGPSNLTAGGLAMGDETGCVLYRGSVTCWGNGSTGIFGGTNNATSATNLGGASAIYSGCSAETICTTHAPDNSLTCWGDNSTGEAGIGSLAMTSVTSPAPVALTTVTSMQIGQYHSCALLKDGSLWCWGDNTHGELGSPVSTTPNPTPTRVTSFPCP
jgi:alpha-tubulin suppressor-like RCC1 family protein